MERPIVVFGDDVRGDRSKLLSVSVIAVAALDRTSSWPTSRPAAGPPQGAEIDIAGPGVDVYSSWVMPDRYNTIYGTSMATSHVAGVAALWSQVSGDTGEALWARVVGAAKALEHPASDVGAGLARRPLRPRRSEPVATLAGGLSRAVKVTVAASHLASIAELEQRLRKAGMEVEQVPPVIGVITGTVPASSSLGSLSAVDGVASIEQQRQFRIPSPDAEVQ